MRGWEEVLCHSYHCMEISDPTADGPEVYWYHLCHNLCFHLINHGIYYPELQMDKLGSIYTSRACLCSRHHKENGRILFTMPLVLREFPTRILLRYKLGKNNVLERQVISRQHLTSKVFYLKIIPNTPQFGEYLRQGPQDVAGSNHLIFQQGWHHWHAQTLPQETHFGSKMCPMMICQPPLLLHTEQQKLCK